MTGASSNSEQAAVSFQPARFSYADLTPEAADIARDAADIIHGVHKAFNLEVGQQLLRAKDVLPHGTFERWVRDVLDIKLRTARNYLSTAQWLDGQPATVADLPPTLLYALSAPSAPKEVEQSVVAAAEAGELLDAKVINTRLDAAKQEARELKAAQRRNPKASRETLAANKAKQQQRWKAQREREEQEQARGRQEAEERMRSLAAAIFACPGDMAARLSHALWDHGQCQALMALMALLEAGLREAAR